MKISNINRVIDTLIEYWKDQGIKTNEPINLSDIKLFEQEKGLTLPEDFILYFQKANGMKLGFPKDFDKEGFFFYSLDEAITVAEEFHLSHSDEMQTGATKCLIFADYMHKSWRYGVRISSDQESYSIGIIPEKSKFREISNSLTDFIKLYLTDSSELYEY